MVTGAMSWIWTNDTLGFNQMLYQAELSLLVGASRIELNWAEAKCFTDTLEHQFLITPFYIMPISILQTQKNLTELRSLARFNLKKISLLINLGKTSL